MTETEGRTDIRPREAPISLSERPAVLPARGSTTLVVLGHDHVTITWWRSEEN